MKPMTMRTLLQAGVHFGHKTRYWNPKMTEYIYGVHHKIHIINLEKTLPMYNKAMRFAKSIAENKGKILFVGTKRVASSIIREEAARVGMPYVDYRWLGGMLTNYKTVRQSIRRLKDLEHLVNSGSLEKMTKKEGLMIKRQLEKLERSLGGIKDMGGLPDALFIIDVKHERIAVTEANRLGIPVIGVVDTNSDPDNIDYLIPGNDDASSTVRLFAGSFADMIAEVQQQSAPNKAKTTQIVNKSDSKKTLAEDTDDANASDTDSSANNSASSTEENITG